MEVGAVSNEEAEPVAVRRIVVRTPIITGAIREVAIRRTTTAAAIMAAAVNVDALAVEEIRAAEVFEEAAEDIMVATTIQRSIIRRIRFRDIQNRRTVISPTAMTTSGTIIASPRRDRIRYKV